MDYSERAFECGATQLGSPYVWRGKGDLLWSANSPGFTRHNWGRNVFDCSGLVTWALWAAGGPDLRLVENAQTLCDRLPPTFGAGPHLRFYGEHDRVTHVAFAWGEDSAGPGVGPRLVLEAAGGDHSTVSPTDGAVVRIGRELRRDCIATRRLEV